ncbi:MAG: HIT family protein [Nanoarchaeota archaeon]|nr:HIT family protein [Nanoarchaeota archaeon]
MDTCIFCKIARKEIPSAIVYEDAHAFAFLDISPVSEGHVIVIPKEHAEKIHQLSEQASNGLISAIKKVSKAAESAFKTGFNLLNNNGKEAGQAVFHVHFHIIPRRGLKDEFKYEWPSKKLEHQEQIVAELKKALAQT